MREFSPDPFLSYVVDADHGQRLRRAADERRLRRHLRRRATTSRVS